MVPALPDAPRSQSPEDDYFNDLRYQISNSADAAADSQPPKAKRIACVLCRKRKLRCDGSKPSCGTCTRLSHDCSYDEVRKKSGPKRGYVKALEARLAQVETLLKTQDPADGPSTDENMQSHSTGSADSQSGQAPNFVPPELDFDRIDASAAMDSFAPISQPHLEQQSFVPQENQSSWEMIGLGLDESLPDAAAIDELNQIFFQKVHPALPILHRARFLNAMNLSPQSRPPICLRYAMWAVAAAITDKYELLQDHFYQRARKYAERDEMRGHGEGMLTISHIHTWIIITSYEFRMTYFPRAWMSAGRAGRLALMLGLNRLDGKGLDVKQCLPPPRDWTDREERRRTFWTCFCFDRYASIGTGWPMMIDERDIATNLPVDEDAFALSQPSPSVSLDEAMTPDGTPLLSPFAGVIVTAALFGRNLTHLHRPSQDENDSNLNGAFWRRHRALDDILSNTSLSLPDHLRLPTGIGDPNIVFLNMCIHTSTICLHQAAIYKADTNKMVHKLSGESKIRCISAAGEISMVMRSCSHQDLATMNPFTSFCLYVAARVFVQYLKSGSRDVQIKASLHFLLAAMHAMKKKNPLTESFLIQLDVDLEAAGLEDLRLPRSRLVSTGLHKPMKKDGCDMDKQFFPRPSKSDYQCQKPTFGNRGLAVHTGPEEHPKGIRQAHQLNRSYIVHGVAGTVSGSNERFALPSRGASTTSSMVSPQDNMDIVNDLSTPSSASAQNASSGVSSSGFSPPSATLDDVNGNTKNWTLHAGQHSCDERPSAAHVMGNANILSFDDNVDMSAFMSDVRDDAMAGPEGMLPQSYTVDAAGTATYMLPPSFNSTGFTPQPSDEMLIFSDADWKQMLDSGMLDLTSWESQLYTAR